MSGLRGRATSTPGSSRAGRTAVDGLRAQSIGVDSDFGELEAPANPLIGAAGVIEVNDAPTEWNTAPTLQQARLFRPSASAGRRRACAEKDNTDYSHSGGKTVRTRRLGERVTQLHTAPDSHAGTPYRLGILMPLRDRMTKHTRRALDDDAARFRGSVRLLTVRGRPVDEARNRLSEMALEHGPFDAVLWVDDDMFWWPGTIEMILTDLRRVGPLDVVAGYFGGRFAFRGPYSYLSAETADARYESCRSFGGWYPKAGFGPGFERLRIGSLCPVTFVGACFVAHRPRLLEVLLCDRNRGEQPWDVSDRGDELGLPYKHLSEDYAFSSRVADCGGRIYVDRGLAIFHTQGRYAFLPGWPSMLIKDGVVSPRGEDTAGPRVSVRKYGAAVDGVMTQNLLRPPTTATDPAA